jgi:hypothetical protein
LARTTRNELHSGIRGHPHSQAEEIGRGREKEQQREGRNRKKKGEEGRETHNCLPTTGIGITNGLNELHSSVRGHSHSQVLHGESSLLLGLADEIDGHVIRLQMFANDLDDGGGKGCGVK